MNLRKITQAENKSEKIERRTNLNGGICFIILAILTFFLTNSIIKYPISLGLLIISMIYIWRWSKKVL
jgi:hypothetical protein